MSGRRAHFYVGANSLKNLRGGAHMWDLTCVKVRGAVALSLLCLGIWCSPCVAQVTPGSGYRSVPDRGASPESLEAALSNLQSQLKIHPRNPALLNALGATYTLKGEVEKARQFFHRALEVTPQFVPARKNLALSYFTSGEYDLAIPRLKELTRNVQSKPFALLLLGMISEARKEYQRAVAFFRDSEQMVFQHSPAILSFARSLFEVREAREAGLVLDRLGYISATGTDDYGQAGLLALNHGQYERAVSLFLRAQSLDHNRSRVDYHLAFALHKIGRHADARQILQALAFEKPEGPALNLLAHVAKELGDLELAVESSRKAVELEPGQEDHYLDLSTLCMDHDNPLFGLEVVEVGLRQIPDSYRLLVQKGVLLERLGRRQEAERVLGAALMRRPEDRIAMVSLAMVQLQDRRFDAAVETLFQAINKFPDDFYVNYAYGVALRRLLETEGEHPERFESARRAFATAIRLNPASADVRYELAKLIVHKDAAAAAAELETVLQLDPKHAPAKYQLGRLYAAMGRREEARKLLDEVEAANITKLNAEKQDRLVILSR